MALWPSEKRQFPPLFDPFLPIFSGFFEQLGREGANWRGLDNQKRGLSSVFRSDRSQRPDERDSSLSVLSLIPKKPTE
jgi:hypothetical protein